MSTSDADRELTAEAARIKQATINHNVRVGWMILILFIVGVAVGVVVWFGQIPMDRDETHFSLALGAGLAASTLGGMVLWPVFPRPTARCPKCGSDWNLQSDGSRIWLDWNCCPQCGLNIAPSGFPREGV